MMKKIMIVFVASLLLVSSVVTAQNLQEGINNLNRLKLESAKSTFQKLVNDNPNNVDAIYWLGQTLIAQKDTAAADALYTKALQANANAPLIMVGKGHTDLYFGKTSDAKQLFESALTLTVHKRKGNDPDILNAIGRANVMAKKGDLAYAVAKLKEATVNDSKNADAWVNYGNALRAADPGKNGSEAFTAYQEALKVNPSYALASYRTAMLFKTQQTNMETYLEHLNKTIEKDPEFARGYQELLYYYIGQNDFAKAETALKNYNLHADKSNDNDYLLGYIQYYQKKYNESLAIANKLIQSEGDKAEAKHYLLASVNYLALGDTANAYKFITPYFEKQEADQISKDDWLTLIKILLGVPGKDQEMYNAVLKASEAQPEMKEKIAVLTEGAAILKQKGARGLAGDLLFMAAKNNPTQYQRAYYDAASEYYYGGNCEKGVEAAKIYTEKWPEETYGWNLLGNNYACLDTSMELGLAVPAYEKLIELSMKDSVANKATILRYGGYLASYYTNTKQDYATALNYLEKAFAVNPEDTTLPEFIKKLKDALGKH